VPGLPPGYAPRPTVKLADPTKSIFDFAPAPAGNYIMSVVSEGKTASILFTIK